MFFANKSEKGDGKARDCSHICRQASVHHKAQHSKVVGYKDRKCEDSPRCTKFLARISPPSRRMPAIRTAWSLTAGPPRKHGSQSARSSRTRCQHEAVIPPPTGLSETTGRCLSVHISPLLCLWCVIPHRNSVCSFGRASYCPRADLCTAAFKQSAFTVYKHQ